MCTEVKHKMFHKGHECGPPCLETLGRGLGKRAPEESSLLWEETVAANGWASLVTTARAGEGAGSEFWLGDWSGGSKHSKWVSRISHLAMRVLGY